MKISFNTKKLEELCNNSKKANKALGANTAKGLKNRLNQLRDVDKLENFKFDNPHPLMGNKKNQFAITIYAGSRLVFKARESNKDDNGNIIWKDVKKINIVYIGDYHE